MSEEKWLPFVVDWDKVDCLKSSGVTNNEGEGEIKLHNNAVVYINGNDFVLDILYEKAKNKFMGKYNL